jgi:transposase
MWSYEWRRMRWELTKAFALTATAYHAARSVPLFVPDGRPGVHRLPPLARLTGDEKRKLRAAGTVAVPDCTKDTLMGKINAATVNGLVFYTDEFTSYNDVAQYGKYVRVNHQERFCVGPAHINRIEGFWSFAKRLYRQVHGVDRDHFPQYLAEYEFRSNHRNDHLPTIRFEALIHPQLREDWLA